MRRSQKRRYAVAVALALLVLVSAALPTPAQQAGAPEPAASALPAAPQNSVSIDVAGFRDRAEATLAAAGAEKGYWGMLITDADTGEILYALNSSRYFSPASNVKLFTTALALATLGPDFHMRTTIETAGAVDPAGRLQGDLVLVGRGDANLSNRVFPFSKKVERAGPSEKALADLADQVVKSGVKEISGDVVADDSYFALVRFPPGWTIDDTVWSYGAAVSAIAINDNSLTLEVRPGAAAGAPLEYTLQPRSDLYEVHNTALTTAAGTEPQLRLSRDPESRVFELSGTLPLDALPRPLIVAVTEPAENAAALLMRLLEARGVRVDGSSRARHAGDVATAPVSVQTPIPQPATSLAPPVVLAEHFSPPLVQDIRLTNKLSLNLHAELLLRVAALEKGGAMNLDDALKFAAQFYQSIGIAPEDVMLNDGSGLSRADLVTPQSITQLLTYAARQDWGATFASTLPVAGEDGTLEGRMKGTAAAGRIHAKTGSFDHVEAISGYATSLRGEHLIFSIFGNNAGLHTRDAAAVVDAICVAMVEELGPASKTSTGAPNPPNQR